MIVYFFMIIITEWRWKKEEEEEVEEESVQVSEWASELNRSVGKIVSSWQVNNIYIIWSTSHCR